jgi:purine catabolism regulator
VFEVPYPVPFIAITEAIYTRLASEQVETFQRSLEAQAALTRSVLDGEGIAGLATALAKVIRGWAVVLDLHGIPLAAGPGSAADRAPRLWEELRESRPSDPGFSVSMLDRGDHVSVQPIGARGRVEAFLAMGKREALTQFDRIVASHALSLLAVELDKSRAVAEAERRMRGDLLDALVEGRLSPEEAARGLRRFGLAPGQEVTVVALESALPGEDLTWAVEDVLSRHPGGFLTAPRDDVVYVVVGTAGTEGLEQLRREASDRLGAPVTLGAGSPVAPEDTGRSFREARYALQVCRVEDRPMADFGSLGTYRLLLTLQEPEALRAFADSVLDALDRYDAEDGGELLGSLRSFLDHNARWEAAAAALFVHRHTLRYRMRKVEELTGRDLSAPHDRMEFWLALRARELLAQDEPHRAGGS